MMICDGIGIISRLSYLNTNKAYHITVRDTTMAKFQGTASTTFETIHSKEFFLRKNNGLIFLCEVVFNPKSAIEPWG